MHNHDNVVYQLLFWMRKINKVNNGQQSMPGMIMKCASPPAQKESDT